MNKTLTNLLRSAFVAVCCFCTATIAQAEIPSVIAAGGTSDSQLVCTIGDAIVSAESGIWSAGTSITTGIDGVYVDGGVVVGNVAADRALNIQLSDEMIAAGAYYNVYNFQGMLLESNKIGTTDYVLNYDHLLRSSQIIVTINTVKGVVATYKLSK